MSFRQYFNAVLLLTINWNWKHLLSLVPVPVCVFFLFLISCENKQDWSHAQEATDELGQAIVKYLSYQSEKSLTTDQRLEKQVEWLHKLRVSKTEYLGWVLPAFPETHFPVEFVWSNLNKKCIVGGRKWAKQYQNRSLEFVSLDFEKEPVAYEGFRLLSGTVLTVKNGNGQVKKLHILGSVIEKSGEYKLLSYRD